MAISNFSKKCSAKHSPEAAESSDSRDPAWMMGIQVVLWTKDWRNCPPFFSGCKKKKELFFTPEHFLSTKVLHQLFLFMQEHEGLVGEGEEPIITKIEFLTI